MRNETMSSRERWLAVLQRRTPDRVPMDYWATPEADEKLMQHLGVATLDEALQRLHVDRPFTVTPAYTGPEIPAGVDMFGCRRQKVRYETGVYSEFVYSPLAQYESVAEIEANYTWPSVDWFDYSAIPGQLRGHEQRPIQGGGSEPFNRYCKLRGREQAMMDLLLAPDIVHYCLDKLFEFCYQDTLRIYEAIPGQVLISYVAEDLGSQNDLLFSLEAIREFLLPHMKRMFDLVHSAGAYVFHHNDGACRKVIPDMIGIGIDVLNPVQWRCTGMEREGLKRDFGDSVVFHGAMDNQYTIPFGTEGEVRQEVRDNIRILGAGAGYILAPCHNIQPVGPAENVVAMYDECYTQGWY